MNIFSKKLNREVNIDAWKQGETIIIGHKALESVYQEIADIQGLHYEYKGTPRDWVVGENHFVVPCVLTDNLGYKVEMIGESLDATLDNEIAKNYPVTMAQNRAFDRAVIAYLGIEKAYSSNEITTDAETSVNMDELYNSDEIQETTVSMTEIVEEEELPEIPDPVEEKLPKSQEPVGEKTSETKAPVEKTEWTVDDVIGKSYKELLAHYKEPGLIPIPFGAAKGKTIAEATDEQRNWIVTKLNEKSKYAGVKVATEEYLKTK